ncbi:hypothetical protein WJX77_003476 [Trebouxia sp. C0004]
MHIRQVIIEGFKSYKDQTIAEPFSNKINTVVGANGSGKSNFFHAVRFVLNDIFSGLRADDRQKLLHEGAGHAVLSAYVEIVFDNSDNRFPVDREEVRLRRTIGLKKDEYYLDKKHITKTEVVNLLETAGFSRANPYYVVQQGKIMAMTTMKDHERLDLLKEIGGTKVYEERREESLKVMKETEGRRKRIEEVVAQLEERLAELDEEREELAKYRQVDKERRSLEYTIYDKDLHETRTNLDKLESARQQEAEEAARVHNEMQEAHTRLKRLDKDLKQLTTHQTSLKRKWEEVGKEKAEAIKTHVKVDLDVKDQEDLAKTDAKTQAQCQKDLKGLAKQIESKQADLEKAQLELQHQQKTEAATQKRIGEAERRLQSLHGKQGKKWSSKKERDDSLNAEVQQLQQTLSKQQDYTQTLQTEVAQLSSACMDKSQEIGNQQAVIKQRKDNLTRCDREQNELHERRNSLQNEKKEIWSQEDSVRRQIDELRGELLQKERRLENAIARDINRGLQAVKQVTRTHNIQGVHGVLLELLSCKSNLHTAVEVTGGNQLFHVVVDNDTVATKIVEVLTRDKMGRATFLPLNRINPSDVNYPDHGSDAVPMLKLLKFSSKFAPAMKQVFGRTMVCKDVDVANRVAHRDNLDGVTMEGTQVSKKGVFKGGFHDVSRSRLDLMKAIKDLQEQVDKANDGAEKREAQAMQVENDLNAILTEMQRLEPKQHYLKEGIAQLESDLASLTQQESSLRKQLEQKETRLQTVEANIQELKQSVQEHQAELRTELHNHLSAVERQELADLTPRLKQLQEEVVRLTAQRMEEQARVTELEDVLNSNLLKRRQELTQRLEQADVETDRQRLESRRKEAQAAEAAVKELTERERRLEGELEEAIKQVRDLKEEADNLKDTETSEAQHVQDEQKALEMLMSKRSALQGKRTELERKIKDLGSLPSEAFEKYRDHTLQELHKLLQKANTQLKQFSHVNKKALDQYTNFTEQREELARRQTENGRGEDKIKQLIQTLDMRKDEAIERTFKQVAKNFREIFGELAPGGRGELVMQKRLRPDPQDEPEAEEEEEAGPSDRPDAMERYAGVKVKVSFGSGETMAMKQLSGGQKTLVALALIFAIQRCDPAPFYLFDEIDAALDPQYRTTVAKMLAKQANDPRNPAQFIITTFHPQIIHETDKVYGVSHQNRISRIDVVNKEDALDFLQSEENRQKTND